MGVSMIAVSRHQISVCTFLGAKPLGEQIDQILASDRYATTHLTTRDTLMQLLEHEKHLIDCLILEQNPSLLGIVKHLHRQATLLPAVILDSDLPRLESGPDLNLIHVEGRGERPQQPGDCLYHTAEMPLSVENIQQLPTHIDQAIAQFLQLSTACRLPHPNADHSELAPTLLQQTLSHEQQRLSTKLKERLGYLGVYYKRDPHQFLRHLSPQEQQRLLEEFRLDYRHIVLSYFQSENTVNQKIDDYVNKLFFADISVSRVLELHMELMEEFSKQLKLEGRSEEILVDYRLALIDTVAHLCEMYRRSIPRES